MLSGTQNHCEKTKKNLDFLKLYNELGKVKFLAQDHLILGSKLQGDRVNIFEHFAQDVPKSGHFNLSVSVDIM